MKFTKKLTLKNTLLVLLFWRLLLFIPQWWGIANLELQNSYLGGGMKNYLSNPYLWSLANFDGEHYLSIARFGYRPLTYFFFPLYPTSLKIASAILGKSEQLFLVAGILVSMISFIFAIIYLTKLLKLDYKNNIVWGVLILLLLSPTSFYFSAVYTESLFLFLVVAGFYYARKGNWVAAVILGALASATRLVGIIMLPALLAEMYIQKEKRYLLVLPVLLGLLVYMAYLQGSTGDLLAFFHQVEIFGDQRSTKLILLPQVFFRYFVRILPNLSWNYFPVVFTTLLELGTAVLFLLASIYSVFKLRLSYSILLIGGYLIPTLAGSFSSLPRYAVVLFPAYILFALALEKRHFVLKLAVSIILLALLFTAESLFVRGYWVS